MKKLLASMFASVAFICALALRADDAAPAAPAPSYHASILNLIGNDAIVTGGAKADPSIIKTKKYLFIYWSAHWCPPCRAFTPKLVFFYNKIHATNGDFDLLFVSSDKSQSDMNNYMKIEKMPWIGLKLASKGTAALKQQWVKRGWTGIPNLMLLDENDKVIASSYDKAGEYIGPETALKAYAKLHKAGAQTQ